MVENKYEKIIIEINPEHAEMLQKWLTKNTRARSNFIKDTMQWYPNNPCFRTGYPSRNNKKHYLTRDEFNGYEYITSEDFLIKEGMIESELIW